jgi:hypothetical protein
LGKLGVDAQPHVANAEHVSGAQRSAAHHALVVDEGPIAAALIAYEEPARIRDYDRVLPGDVR